MFDSGIEKAYPADAGSSLAQAARRPSMKERILGEKRNIEARLDQLNEALKVLEESPQIEKVLEILSKTIY
jgi:hypothetical protein